jgi:hypothetical protein
MKRKCHYNGWLGLILNQQKQVMNDSLKKMKATLESTLEASRLLSGKGPIRLTQAKEPKNAFLKQTETNFATKQVGRDWWWCDDV